MADKTSPRGRTGQGGANVKSDRVSARERMAAARAVGKRREQRRRIMLWSVAGVTAAVVAAGAVWGVSAKNAADRRADRATERAAAVPGTGRPPWPRPNDTAMRAKAAGLAVSAMEGAVTHFHVHLDVLVNGQRIPVPANLGIDTSSGSMAEMHTHDDTGVVHIEAPTAGKTYTLRQVFDEWNVKFDAADLGGLKAGPAHPLAVYVNGRKQTGDPGAIRLAAHQEIAVVYGSSSAQIPSSYAFPQGE